MINLAYDLNIRQLSIDDTAKLFGLSDLRAAITDFLAHKRSHGVDAVHVIGGPHRAAGNAELPFKHLQV